MINGLESKFSDVNGITPHYVAVREDARRAGHYLAEEKPGVAAAIDDFLA